MASKAPRKDNSAFVPSKSDVLTSLLVSKLWGAIKWEGDKPLQAAAKRRMRREC